MSADRERQHLNGDVRPRGHRHEVVDLPAHDRRSAYQPLEDRFVEYHVELEWIVLGEQRLSGLPDVDPTVNFSRTAVRSTSSDHRTGIVFYLE